MKTSKTSVTQGSLVALDRPRIARHPYPSGTEYFLFPGRLARQIWMCPRCFGRARHAAGFRMGDRTETTWRVRQGYLLHFIQAGSFWHRVGDRTHTAQAGEACLIDLSDDVAFGNSGPGEACLYWVCFNGRDAPRLFADLRAEFEPVYRGANRRRMTALFRDLMRLGEAPPPAVDVEAAGLLMLMLAPLFAARGPTVSVAAAGAPDRMLSDGLRRAIDYVGRLYDQPVSVKTIARDTWQNPEQLSRRFRRELDMTPTEFLTLYRIEQAKLMLEDTNKPVAQVAHSVGFPDENYFIRQFTKVAGQTPRHYRSDRRSHPSS